MAGTQSEFDDNDDVISGINVTPLVDVVLVLLIIFMITAPVIYQNAIKVQLPTAASGEAPPQGPIEFAITRDGQVSWGKDLVSWEELSARLQALGPAAAEKMAVISADEATPHGTVIKLMDALRQAGLSKLAVNVQAPAK